jgi:hypothetical protein
LLVLLFDTEDGGNIFLRNVGRLSTDYTALYSRRHNHRCEKRKSYIREDESWRRRRGEKREDRGREKK